MLNLPPQLKRDGWTSKCETKTKNNSETLVIDKSTRWAVFDWICICDELRHTIKTLLLFQTNATMSQQTASHHKTELCILIAVFYHNQLANFKSNIKSSVRALAIPHPFFQISCCFGEVTGMLQHPQWKKWFPCQQLLSRMATDSSHRYIFKFR